jgi:phosphoribosylanthranilate isomerase
MSVWVKICGITSVEDANVVLDAGADAVGLNFVPSSKRRVDVATARRVRESVAGRAEVVAVVANLSVGELEELRERTGIRWLQLHGNESGAELARVLPEAYKAARVADAADVAALSEFGGERLLVDAKVPGELGGTGQTFDWSLVQSVARERKLVLAGGLTPDNVADALRFVRPHGVDTASGVEGADPRRKDADKVARFVRAARGLLLAMTTLALFGCSSKAPARELVAPDTPLPGVVAGMFAAEHCRDASGAPFEPGPRLFVALAPPGLVGSPDKLRQGAYPPGVIALFDQRVGYESALLGQGRRQGGSVVFETGLESAEGHAFVERISLPVSLAERGKLELARATAERGREPGAGPVLSCELASLVPGLDRVRSVDYEPG